MRRHRNGLRGVKQLQYSEKRVSEFHRILECVLAINPLQRKRIETFLEQASKEYWTFAEELSCNLNHSFLLSDEDRIAVAKAYKKMCMDLLREQIRFKKSGVFHEGNAGEVYKQVYSQDDVMRYYLVGLLLSYLFWPNHYKMFRFFQETTAQLMAGNYLEVGAGHGLFTAEIRKKYPEMDMTIVDISKTAIDLATEIISSFRIDASSINFMNHDFLKINLDGQKFDFIAMGEVLEHVTNPLQFLCKARELISPEGLMYMSTCVNAPAIDHIYHFMDVISIQTLLQKAGFLITSEIILPVEDVTEDKWFSELVPINYAAICRPL